MKALDPFNIDLEKTTLIEASAGTGKTYTITTLYCRLVAKGFPVESILVVTFTEAAAAELKLRIRQRLSDVLKQIQIQSLKDLDNHSSDDDLVEFFIRDQHKNLICKRLALGISCFDQASILTIHSFCLKILKENAFESGYLFDMKLMPDRSVFFNQVSYDFFMARINHLDALMLKYFDKRKITPENFSKSFNSVVSRKKIRIKPDTVRFINFFDEYRANIVQIETILKTQTADICELFIHHDGIHKQSYNKKNVPKWLEDSYQKIKADGPDTFFNMTEKGDSLFKFCTSRLETKTKTGKTPPSHELFERCETLLQICQGFENNLIALKQDFLIFFNETLGKIKTDQGICFFDDLINDLFEALETDTKNQLCHAVRDTYSACLIDEFQDTDPIQYEIFSRLFCTKGTPFFMIGDPKQAIYAFRGGDIFAYLNASKTCDQQFTLEQNYRSGPLLVNGVNQIFSLAQNPFMFDSIEFSKVTTPKSAVNSIVCKDRPIVPLQFGFIRRQDDNTGTDGYLSQKTANTLIPKITAQQIGALINSDHRLVSREKPEDEKITPGDIAVLVRTNRQAQQIYEALFKYGIPAYISKSGSVYETKQAVDLLDILTAVCHPENKGYLKAALCTDVYNFNAGQLFQMESEDQLFYAWQERFIHYNKTWDEKGFVRMIMEILHSEHSFLKTNPGIDERKLTNFYHLVELISTACIKLELSPYYLMKWYVRQLNGQFRDEQDSADELRLESDKKAVGIITVHKSKGLEYPIVYLPYMWEGERSVKPENILYHDPEKKYCLTLDLGSKEYDKAAECFQSEAHAEMRRLLYVALTRASGMCNILWAGIKNIQTSALAEILHPNGCKDDEIMIRDLNSLRSACPESIDLDFWEDKPSFDKLQAQTTSSSLCSLSPLQMTRNLNPKWRISSFSGVTKSTHTKFVLPENKHSESHPSITLADFPKGPRAGDLFHSIFEIMDFTKKITRDQPGIQSVFDQFRYTEPGLIETGIKAINQVVDTQLNADDVSFCLKDISNRERLNEMEFLFSVNSFNRSWVKKALEISSSKFKTSGYTDSLSQFDMMDFKGFLKGFIDLVIQHKGKWYIIDYKSNYIGDTYDMYSGDILFEEMGKHHYFLQYHIYTAALDRYLKHRLNNYDYDVHFGGVFYLFIRGMHPDFSSKNGIFFDRPPQNAIGYWSDNLS